MTHSDVYQGWSCSKVGDYHDLTIEEFSVSDPSPAQLVVSIKAFSPGFPDMLMTQGNYQLKPKLPFTPCAEFSGVVSSIGKNVRHFAVGDQVIGSVRHGAAATKVLVDQQDVFKLPSPFDFVKGAAFLVAYKTAYIGLVSRGSLRAMETVLVHGAGGGVGLAAVQLAKAYGAIVIALATGRKKCEVLQKTGADHVLDYAGGSFKDRVNEITSGRGADVIYDPIGGVVFEESLKCIASLGRVLVIGFASGQVGAVRANHALIKQYSVIGVRAGEFGRLHPEQGAEAMRQLLHMAESGLLIPYVNSCYKFEKLIDAFDEIYDRRVVGRAVVLV
jgi:NADPH2:quinone reductase